MWELVKMITAPSPESKDWGDNVAAYLGFTTTTVPGMKQKW